MTGEDVTRDVVESFLRAVTEKRRDDVRRLLAPDVRLEIPLSFTGGPEPALVATGIEQVHRYWDDAMSRFSTMRLLDRSVEVTSDGGTAYVRGRGDFEAATGQTYRNVYVWRIEVDAASRAIRSIDEYANPITFAQTFGTPA
jgi:ketosteroid isomerase-like protein